MIPPSQQQRRRRSSSSSSSTSSTMIERKTKRRVSFALDENDSSHNEVETSAAHDHHDEVVPCLTEEDCRELWYQPEELGQFKTSIRDLVLGSLKKNVDNNNNDNDEDLCGLERYSVERTTYKKSAIYYTLCAQKRKLSPDIIRKISERCTGWACAVARDQAFKDYCDVYDPLRIYVHAYYYPACDAYRHHHTMEGTSRSMSSENDPVSDCKRKRVQNDNDDHEPLSLCGAGDRRVRQRTMPDQPLCVV